MSQRWRLTIARGPAARDLQQRDLTPAWDSILAAVAAAAAAEAAARSTAEPARTAEEREAGRPRVVLAAPLPAGMTASAELVDLLVPIGRLTAAGLRSLVEPRLPPGHVLVGAIDIWIGEPSLPSLLTGAAYSVDVAAPPGISGEAVVAAAAGLLAESLVPRPGRDSGRPATNLRPLIQSVAVEPASIAGATARLRMRLRLDPDLGSGRPDEVVAALGRYGPPLAVLAAHRDGLELRDPVKPVRERRAPAAGSGRAGRPVRRSA